MAGATAPRVDDAAVHFRVADPARRLRGVRLWQEVGLADGQTAFAHRGDAWTLRVPRPPVDRLEYLFEVSDGSSTELVLDAGNPRTVPGAFGAKSVVEFDAYQSPWWLAARRQPGSMQAFTVPAPRLDAAAPVAVWSPVGSRADQPLPLLVAHDGPEYDLLGGLTTYSAAQVAAGRLPPHRVALLAPVARDEWYSANPEYADALCRLLLPAIRQRVPVTGRVVGIGVSLGALALLHAQCSHPGVFDGLFLQSGSFFVPVHDHMEADFAYFGRVVRWVLANRGRTAVPDPVPVVLTCGGVEENLPNNRIMWRTLAKQQYPTGLVVNRDAHNFTGWRDCLDPHLTRLLRQVWHAA